MFVNLYVVSPVRGSLLRVITTSCNSGEYQRSLTIWMARSLPISPAGIVTVVRVPSASTPSIFCFPRFSLTSLALLVLVLKKKVSPTPPASVCILDWSSGGCVVVTTTLPLVLADPCATLNSNCSPFFPLNSNVKGTLLSAVCERESSEKVTPATGSLIKIVCNGSSPAPNMPRPLRLCSRRVRPSLSRYNMLVMRLTMRLPSARVWIVSVTASAEYGAPLMTLTPKLSVAKNTTFASGGGGGPPPGPCTIRSCLTTMPPAGCCANAMLANANNRATPNRSPDILFIISSFQLTRRYHARFCTIHRPLRRSVL